MEVKRKAHRMFRQQVCHPVTTELLKTFAYYSLSGDPLSPPGYHHRGDPDAVDPVGVTKRKVYEATVNDDMTFFEELAVAWNNDRWHEFAISRRTYKRKDDKLRPIDLSSEYRRLLCLWVRDHLDRLVAQKKYLLPTIVGFRHLWEFEDYRDREDGFTIQDVFVSTVWRLVRLHGSWVVLIDQRDAFGNIPHAVIHAALKELGVPQRDRRAIIELVRIRTVLPDGTILKPRRYGIEQGNYLAPLVFNIVQSFLARRLPVPMACYGDDLVLVAPTEAEAQQAFDAYKQLTDPFGYKNTRGLDDSDKKRTRILDTRVELVPLIKTYELGRGRIGLTKKKEAELLQQLPANQTLPQVRRANTWKAVSRVYLVTLTGSPSAGTDRGSQTVDDPDPSHPGPANRRKGTPSRHDRTVGPRTSQRGMGPTTKGEMDGGTGGLPSGTQDDRSSLVEDGSSSGDVGMRLSSPMPDSTLVGAGGVPANTQAPGADGGRQAGDAVNGRSAASRGGSGAGVTADLNGREGTDHRPSLPDTVLPIRDDDIKALVEGRKLKAGDHYRGTIIDCRELSHQIPASRMAHAVQQLCRVGSLHGRVHLLVHPGDDWVNRADVLVDGNVKRCYERAEGSVLRLLRGTAIHTKRYRPRRSATPPRTTDLVIRAVRWHRDHATSWSVEVENGHGREVLHVRVTSPNPGIGRVEAVAMVLDHHSPVTVAVRATGLLRQLLGEEPVRVRQVGLADGIATIQRWEWTAEGMWLVGS